MSTSPTPDYVDNLMQYIRDAIRLDFTSHYSTLAPRKVDNGSIQTMVVKDDRHPKTLRVVVTESE